MLVKHKFIACLMVKLRMSGANFLRATNLWLPLSRLPPKIGCLIGAFRDSFCFWILRARVS
jgi:hypothetical protein